MIRTETVALYPGEDWSRRISDQEIRLVAAADDRRGVLDVAVHAFGASKTYARFAECILGRQLRWYFGEVEIAWQDESPVFVTVVGLYKVLFLDFAALSIRELLSLYREETDDRSFYRMQLHPLADSFLINYESGIARIADTGEVAWHRKMVWNDVYVKEEDGALLFKNEINPKGFLISFADGSKFPK
jgi:hypothetical protein